MIPIIELNDCSSQNPVGFGVFQIAPEKTAQAVKMGNEHGVGQGLQDAGPDRDFYSAPSSFVSSSSNHALT
jgi:hypothetical protein